MDGGMDGKSSKQGSKFRGAELARHDQAWKGLGPDEEASRASKGTAAAGQVGLAFNWSAAAG
ncbi:hypothetical protein VP1G_11208 [Cytospora mali]|uniref:Uncharacterized protein n=1 Tax=Cytospora mali TaxID=578113 RepID=A0A194V822_CYTMA|nr:hypothetical protein VP1G_11208 [Valsa mali var. pyri (nom. inval.)]